MPKVKRHGKGRGVNAKGRSERAERFWMLTFAMARSPAFRTLSGPALKVLVELRCHFDGANNGNLFLSYQDAATRLALSKSSVARAFGDLIERGFIRRTREGQWYGRLAHTWAVTDLPVKDGQPPPNDWRHWQPSAAGASVPARHAKPKSVSRRHATEGDGAIGVPTAADRAAKVPTGAADASRDGAASILHLHSTKGEGSLGGAQPPGCAAQPRERKSVGRHRSTPGGLADG